MQKVGAQPQRRVRGGSKAAGRPGEYQPGNNDTTACRGPHQRNQSASPRAQNFLPWRFWKPSNYGLYVQTNFLSLCSGMQLEKNFPIAYGGRASMASSWLPCSPGQSTYFSAYSVVRIMPNTRRTDARRNDSTVKILRRGRNLAFLFVVL